MSEMYIYANNMCRLLVHLSYYHSAFYLIPWHVFLKNKNKTNLDWQNFFLIPKLLGALVTVFPISVKDIFASSSSTHLLIQTDFLLFLACVSLCKQSCRWLWQVLVCAYQKACCVANCTLCFSRVDSVNFLFCFIFPHDRASYDP